MVGKLARIFRLLVSAPAESLSVMARHRRVLVSTTRVELNKRYAGSLLGKSWVVLNPLLFLAIYLFVYLVVFRVKLPGFSSLDYVVYVFSGLVPYIAFMEAVTVGAVAIKQNIHLIKNVILPIDLIPVRVVAIGIAAQLVGMAMIFVLSAINGTITSAVLFLPLAILLEVMFLLGVVWIMAAVGAILPDVGYFANLMVLLLMFISPIAFRPDMVPGGLSWVVDFNPIYYMTELFRFSLLGDGSPQVLLIAAAGSVVVFAVGSAFFHRFKTVLVDYE